MKNFFILEIVAPLLLFMTASIHAQDAQHPWHLITFENTQEVAFYNIEVISGIEVKEQSITIVLENGKKFSHPLTTTTFGFAPRQKGFATANESIAASQQTVHYANGILHFSETVNNISIYTVNGIMVAQFKGNYTEVPIRLPSGIFIVQAGGKGMKLFVSNSYGGTITQTEVKTKSPVYASAPISLRTGNDIKVYWNIIAAYFTSIEIPNVEKFHFTADNSIVFTMKNGDISMVDGYQEGEFAIEPIQPDMDLCSFLAMESVNKTIPVINDFLAGLQKSLNDKQKLQMLTEWLKSFSCIIDATIPCESCIYTNPVMSEIMISFKENGITKDLIFDIKMTNPLQVSNIHEHYTPMDVFVKTNRYFTIDKVFDFINEFDHDVKLIQYGVYVSTMPPSKLQSILDSINSKSYTNDGKDWWTSGYLHYATNQIFIFPMLYNMKNKDYQNDWLQTMDEYNLFENFTYDFSGYVIHFRVSEGTEKQWEAQFKKYEFVEWAELNYLSHIILGSSE